MLHPNKIISGRVRVLKVNLRIPMREFPLWLSHSIPEIYPELVYSPCLQPLPTGESDGINFTVLSTLPREYGLNNSKKKAGVPSTKKGRTNFPKLGYTI